ncbi:hypothetical protein BJ138DRAFT_139797 [Hygrophoropsis aurantiaca]|uniref:Uncharacterized protein n=1 Tax=Hygrophoropsis aurantiaca TaxID=72124 RepID=A0ACB8AAF3_9AGAM|nr:hypothetical protein BJ138DRAFT_139797 [Hygrophoropsis aurantiaca]
MLHHVFPSSQVALGLRQAHRHFVSTVLLSRTWESETLVVLRKEAKNRGLSTKGNKPALVSRIQSYEEHQVQAAAPVVHRNVSSSSSSTSTSTPAQAVVPGLPSAPGPAPSKNTKGEFMAIKLPDLSQPEPEAPTPIPSLADSWDSAQRKPTAQHASEAQPKIHVVSGSATHHGGGPTHGLENGHEAAAHADADALTTLTASGSAGLLRGLGDDLGLPRAIRLRPDTRDQVQTGDVERPLDGEERKGVWVLLGLLGGSWLLGGYVNGAPADKGSTGAVTPADTDSSSQH